MELLQFGHAGDAYIVFPTSLGKFFEYEDRGMIGALADKIDGGDLQLFCVSTIDDETFYGKHLHPRVRIDRYLAWERYLLEDSSRSPPAAAAGRRSASPAAASARITRSTMALRHPDIFTACVTMGGAFNIERFLDGYHDQDTLPALPAAVPARPRRLVVPRSPSPQQVGARHRRARHLPRRHRAGRGAARRERHPPQPARLGQRLGPRLARVAADGERVHSVTLEGPRSEVLKSGVSCRLE